MGTCMRPLGRPHMALETAHTTEELLLVSLGHLHTNKVQFIGQQLVTSQRSSASREDMQRVRLPAGWAVVFILESMATVRIGSSKRK